MEAAEAMTTTSCQDKSVKKYVAKVQPNLRLHMHRLHEGT